MTTVDDSLDFVRQTIESFPSETLANWLRDRLSSRDRHLVTRSSEPSYYLIASIHRHLDRSVQADLARAAMQMLREVADGTWDSESATALLRLTDPLLVGTHHESAAIDLLLQILQAKPSLSGHDDTAFAALQGLVTLEYSTTPRFWSDILQRDARYAATVVEGMARTLFGSLRDWLLRTLPHREVEVALINVLPLLIEDSTGDEVMQLLIAIEPRLSSSARKRVRTFAKREQLTLRQTSDDLLLTYSTKLLRCVAFLLREDSSNDADRVRAFTECAKNFRYELRRKRDAQSTSDERLLPLWKTYVEVIEGALSRGKFGEAALEELHDSLTQVGARKLAADLRAEAGDRHPGPPKLSKELRENILRALLLNRQQRDIKEQFVKRDKAAGRGSALMAKLKAAANAELQNE